MHEEDCLEHDLYYEIDSCKIKADLGRHSEITFEDCIVKTSEWFLENQMWMESVTSVEYQE